MAEWRASNSASELQLRPRGHRTALARSAIAVPVLASAALAMMWSQVFALLVLALLLLAITGRGTGTRLARWNARRRREGARLQKVRQAGTMRERQYEDLRALAETCDERDVARFDLEGLLDAFASTALAHRRQVRALDFTTCTDTMVSSSRRQRIRALRLRHRDACVLAASRLEDELAAIDDLVRLIVQRIAMPAFDRHVECECEIDRRLADLDEIDRAYGELAAETERSPEHRGKPEAPDQRSEGWAESNVRGGRMKHGVLADTG
jgi:hypothetical protein